MKNLNRLLNGCSKKCEKERKKKKRKDIGAFMKRLEASQQQIYLSQSGIGVGVHILEGVKLQDVACKFLTSKLWTDGHDSLKLDLASFYLLPDDALNRLIDALRDNLPDDFREHITRYVMEYMKVELGDTEASITPASKRFEEYEKSTKKLISAPLSPNSLSPMEMQRCHFALSEYLTLSRAEVFDTLLLSIVGSCHTRIPLPSSCPMLHSLVIRDGLFDVSAKLIRLCPNLHTLILENDMLVHMDGRSLLEGVEGSPLRKLVLRRMDGGDADARVQAALQRLIEAKQLSEVVLDRCYGFQVAPVVSFLVKRLERLTSLRVNIQGLPVSVISTLSSAQHVSHLSFNGLTTLTDSHLASLVYACTHVRHLDLSQTDIDHRKLFSFGKALTKFAKESENTAVPVVLEVIDLSGLRLDEDSVLCVMKSTSSLRKVVLDRTFVTRQLWEDIDRENALKAKAKNKRMGKMSQKKGGGAKKKDSGKIKKRDDGEEDDEKKNKKDDVEVKEGKGKEEADKPVEEPKQPIVVSTPKPVQDDDEDSDEFDQRGRRRNKPSKNQPKEGKKKKKDKAEKEEGEKGARRKKAKGRVEVAEIGQLKTTVTHLYMSDMKGDDWCAAQIIAHCPNLEVLDLSETVDLDWSGEMKSRGRFNMAVAGENLLKLDFKECSILTTAILTRSKLKSINLFRTYENGTVPWPTFRGGADPKASYWPDLHTMMIPHPDKFLIGTIPHPNLTFVVLSTMNDIPKLRMHKSIKTCVFFGCQFYEDGFSWRNLKFIPHVIFVNCVMNWSSYLDVMGIERGPEPPAEPDSRTTYWKEDKERATRLISFFNCCTSDSGKAEDMFDGRVVDEKLLERCKERAVQYPHDTRIPDPSFENYYRVTPRHVYMLRSMIPFVEHVLITTHQQLRAILGTPCGGYHPNADRDDYVKNSIWELGKTLRQPPPFRYGSYSNCMWYG